MDNEPRVLGPERDRRGSGAFFRLALWYTLLFAVMAAVFLPFHLSGKSFAWNTDGLSQTMAQLSFLS